MAWEPTSAPPSFWKQRNAGAAPAPEARIAAVVGAGGVSPIYYFHTDQVGTTRAVTDGNGNNIANCGQNASYPNGSFLEYTSFGGARRACRVGARRDPGPAVRQAGRAATPRGAPRPSMPGGCGQSTLPYTFAGQYQDAESGQQAFLARYYSDTTARFITPDPAGLAAADPVNPQSWNEYAYVDGQPLTSTDPTGLFPWSSLLPWNWNLCGGDCGGQPWDLPLQDLTALIDGLIAQFPQAGPPPLQHISTSTSHQPQRGQIAAKTNCGPRAAAFVATNKAYADRISNRTGISAVDLLGLSALESNFGTSNLAVNHNNYFGLTVGRAFKGTIGVYKTEDGRLFGEYPSPGFLTSGLSFAMSFQGARVTGLADPLEFAQRLTSPPLAFNSEPGYAQKLVDRIAQVTTCF